MSSLTACVHELHGQNVFVKVTEYDSKNREDIMIEVYRDYTDTHYIVTGVEYIARAGVLFGTHLSPPGKPLSSASSESFSSFGRGGGGSLHTYLRLTPELGRNIDGPHNGSESMVTGERHPILKGFDKTDIIPFGSILEPVKTDSGAKVLLTFIPVSPIMP